MSDLVERLRTRPTGDPYLHMMVHEDADRIEALTAERDALQSSLRVASMNFEAVAAERDRLREELAEATNMSYLCIRPACGNKCSDCNHAISPQAMRDYAVRYSWLRDKLSRIACNVNPVWDAEQAETTKIAELWVMEHFRATDPESTDAAIDAAMRKPG